MFPTERCEAGRASFSSSSETMWRQQTLTTARVNICMTSNSQSQPIRMPPATHHKQSSRRCRVALRSHSAVLVSSLRGTKNTEHRSTQADGSSLSRQHKAVPALRTRTAVTNHRTLVLANFRSNRLLCVEMEFTNW